MNKITLQGEGFKADSPILTGGIKCQLPSEERVFNYEDGVKSLGHIVSSLHIFESSSTFLRVILRLILLFKSQINYENKFKQVNSLSKMVKDWLEYSGYIFTSAMKKMRYCFHFTIFYICNIVQHIHIPGVPTEDGRRFRYRHTDDSEPTSRGE